MLSKAIGPNLPARLEVFAVEDTAVQVTWRGLPSGELSLHWHDGSGARSQPLGAADRPGAADIDDLAPSTTYQFSVRVDEREIETIEATTADQPTTPVTKIATISDLHLGETSFGVTRPFREAADATPYPLRCAIAAVREAQAWGAELIVIKGDITEHSRAHEWDMFDQVLDEIDVDVVAIPGNHDVEIRPQSLDGRQQLAQRELFGNSVDTLDLDTVRLVLADTTVRGRTYGHIGAHRDDLLSAVDVNKPAMIFTHHHLQRRTVPTIWPLGVPQHDGVPLVTELATRNPNLFASCGHTHRNRAYQLGSVPASEVSSTKDFPGVWAGYQVHADGFHQCVRRVAAPSCVRWTDQTFDVLNGVWGWWSIGELEQRSFSHRWSSSS